jgi:hypothetical protein
MSAKAGEAATMPAKQRAARRESRTIDMAFPHDDGGERRVGVPLR